MDRVLVERVMALVGRGVFLSVFSALILLMMMAMGCGREFAPRSEIASVRLLAVQADKPYPKPGETAQLKMLWHDGKAPVDEPRQVQQLWVAGCFNPEGDLFYRCFEQLAKVFQGADGQPNPDVASLIGFGDSFSLTIPEDLISRRPSVQGLERYGVSYVFVALCAGRFALAESVGEETQAGEYKAPFTCLDGEGNELGAEDFVFGYYRLYSFDNQTNDNPSIVGLEVDGVRVSPDEPPVYPVCVKGQKCPERKVRVVVDPSTVQENPSIKGADGQSLGEQMWVEYLATGGEVGTGSKLVNDAVKGFNEDSATTYKAPEVPGKQYFFAVLRDNRGGVAWVKQPMLFE